MELGWEQSGEVERKSVFHTTFSPSSHLWAAEGARGEEAPSWEGQVHAHLWLHILCIQFCSQCSALTFMPTTASWSKKRPEVNTRAESASCFADLLPSAWRKSAHPSEQPCASIHLESSSNLQILHTHEPVEESGSAENQAMVQCFIQTNRQTSLSALPLPCAFITRNSDFTGTGRSDDVIKVLEM